MSVFKCNHVSYSYDKNTNVLKDITFSFELGKVYAILGSSGSGKTTLLSLLVQKFLNKWTIFLFCSILFSSNQKEH